MTEPYKQQLENLEEALSEFTKNNLSTNVFNVFETLRVTNMEIRHSIFLAWIMNPEESHGLGPSFLELFLESVLEDHGITDGLTKINAARFEVRREWNNIDLILVNEVDKVIIAIENKVWSGESNDQLMRYERICKRVFRDFRRMYIFLSPSGAPSSKPNVWKSVSYQLIVDCLSRILNDHKDHLKIDVSIFIRHYMDNVRRNIVGDEKLKKRAVEVYYNNQEAFDFITKAVSESRDMYKQLVIEYLDGQDDLILDDSNKYYIRFTTPSIDRILPKRAVKWTNSKRILLFEVDNQPHTLRLLTVLAESTGAESHHLLEAIHNSEHQFVFNNIAQSMNKKIWFEHIKIDNIIEKSELSQLDLPDMKQVLFENLEACIENHVKEVERVIVKLDSEGVLRF